MREMMLLRTLKRGMSSRHVPLRLTLLIPYGNERCQDNTKMVTSNFVPFFQPEDFELAQGFY
jgi:hypothetical protein